MNTESHPMPESFSPPRINSDQVSVAQVMYWSIRREFWENRTLYVAPLAVAALFLFGFMISLLHLPAKMRAAAQGPAFAHVFMDESYGFAALIMMGTMIIVAFFYCLDALYSERRDRSILFWKSLPVSDLTSVLSKASIPLLILPLLCFAVTIVLWVVIWILSSGAALASGHSVAALRTTLPLSYLSFFLLFHLVGIHGLWYAPIYGWMLMVSSWARRAPFLWATLPLFVIGVLERIAFNTSHFANLMGYILRGGGHRMEPNTATGVAALVIPDQTLGQFFASPGLWMGFAVSAVFLIAAIRLRRSNGPI